MARDTDPVLKNARREGLVIAALWLAATSCCCIVCGRLGYPGPDRPLGTDDIHPILGMPAWVFWGIMVPWAVCAVFTFWFAGCVMADDDLGKDNTPELEDDIRQGGLHE